MKTLPLIAAAFALASPALAQPDAINPANGLPFRVLAPAAAEILALPKPFQLDLKDVTLDAALRELQKQSGVSFDINASEAGEEKLAKPVSLELETRSFNRAFAEIMGEAGVKASLQRSYSSRPWSINWSQGDGGAKALQSGVGLFEVRLMSLNTTLSKTVKLSGDADKEARRVESNFLNVGLTLTPDLRLPIVGAARTRVTRATDDQGRSLLNKTDADERGFSSYSFYQNNWEQGRTNLRLRAPADDAGALSHLEGAVVYALVAKTEVWEVPDLLSKTEWKRTFQSDGQKFEMTLTPTFKDERLSVRIEVLTNRPNGDNQVGHPLMATSPVFEGLRVFDATGTPLRGDSNGGSNSNTKMSVNAVFYPLPRPRIRTAEGEAETPVKTLTMPLKLVFEAPVDVVQTEVPFSFSDVPLP